MFIYLIIKIYRNLIYFRIVKMKINILDTLLNSFVIEKQLKIIFIIEFIKFNLILIKYRENFKKTFFFIDPNNTLNENFIVLIRFLIISNFKYTLKKSRIIKSGDDYQIYMFSLLKYFEILKLFFYILRQLQGFSVLVFLKKKIFYEQYCKDFLKLKMLKSYDWLVILKNSLNKQFLKKTFTEKLHCYYRRYRFFLFKLKDFRFKFYLIQSRLKKVKLDIYINNQFLLIKNIQILGPMGSVKFIQNFKIRKKSQKKKIKKLYKFFKKFQSFLEGFKLKKNYYMSTKCLNFLNLSKSIVRIIKIFNNNFLKSHFENLSIWYKFCLRVKFDILFYSFSKFYPKNCKQSINEPVFFMNFLNFTSLNMISISKKNLFTILENNRFFFWILKQFSCKYNHKLILLLFKIENMIFNYGRSTFNDNIRKLFFEIGAQDSFLNWYMILCLSKNFNVSFSKIPKKNFSRLLTISVFPKKKFFLINFFICQGSTEFFKIYIGNVLDTQFKKQLKYIGVILKLFKMNGTIGKNLIELLYSTLFLSSWNLVEKKIFWKYWVFIEIFKCDRISRQILFNLRLTYFFLNQYKLFNENFF